MHETPEEAERSQQQIEDFARLAHDVRRAIKQLEDAFAALESSPELIAEDCPILSERPRRSPIGPTSGRPSRIRTSH